LTIKNDNRQHDGLCPGHRGRWAVAHCLGA
jgi:hypothetical protein